MARGKPAIFDLELRPGRSLAPRTARWLVAGTALLLLLLGLRFALIGAWPVLAFMILDALLLGLAFAASFRAARASEHLRLDADGLELVRIASHGAARRTRLDAADARVELERLGDDDNRLWLTSARGRLPLGQFLSPAERAEVARVIADGLARWRRTAG